MINKINLRKTPQAISVKFLRRMETESLLAYRHISKRLIKDIIDIMREEKLAKSDGLQKPKGWMGKLAKIEIDLNEKIGPVIEKYLKGFNWILFGEAADKESKKVAKDLNLMRLFHPGSAISSYLVGLDANREFFKDIFGKDPGFPKQVMKESIQSIPKMSSIVLGQSMSTIKTGMLLALKQVIDNHNSDQLNDAFESLQGVNPEDKKEIKRIGENLDEYISSTRIEIDLRRAARKLERGYVMTAQDVIGNASSLATHQSMYEIYGRNDDDFDVLFVTSELENVCDFCTKLSKNPDGTYIKYKVSSFKPAGYNYGKKKKDWRMCMGKQHPNCYCSQIYKPKGWTISDEDLIRPK